MKKGNDYTGVAVGFSCHDGNGNFLFTQRGEQVRDGQGTWELPAGGIEFGETIEEALLRELKEELCVEPKKIEKIGYKDVIQKDGDDIIKHWILFEFLVEVDRAKVQIGEPEHCTALSWGSLDNPPQPLHFGVKETIGNVQKFIKNK